MAYVKVTDLERIELYQHLIGIVVPRPIAWVTSMDENEVVNLAPYSAYNMVCSNPICVSLAIGFKPERQEKDTLTNIKLKKEFVVNTPRPEHVKQVALSAAVFPSGVSEVEKAGMKLEDSNIVSVPRLADAIFSLECKLHDIIQIGDGSPGSASLVIGQVQCFHIDDDVYSAGRFDFDKVKVLSRLGGYCYAELGNVLEEKVPAVDTLESK